MISNLFRQIYLRLYDTRHRVALVFKVTPTVQMFKVATSYNGMRVCMREFTYVSIVICMHGNLLVFVELSICLYVIACRQAVQTVQ